MASDYQPWSKCMERRRKAAREIAEQWCEGRGIALEDMRARTYEMTRYKFMLVTHLRNLGFSFSIIGETIDYSGQSARGFHRQAQTIGIR